VPEIADEIAARERPVLHDPAIAGYVAVLWPSRDDASPAVLIDLDDDPIGRADLAWLEAMTPGPISLIQTPGGRHRIASWAERVIPALQKLLDGQCEG
jgi:hypothetical protein